MKDVLDTLEGWNAEGLRFATATVVKIERSAPLGPGAVLAVSEKGEVAGSVTGGCVEPAVYEEAQEVLAGGPPRLVSYGIADEEAFEVGLPCGGPVHIFLSTVERDLVEGRPGHARDDTRDVHEEIPGRLGGCVDGEGVLELHAANAAFRLVATISAATATATSSGVLEPILRPMGAWMRANCSSVTPSARRRSFRASVVRLAPIAPM